MFVITADQIDSRHDRDRAGEMIARLAADFGPAFLLPPDQTSGDEIQALLTDAATALDVVFALHRSGHWSIGLGIGPVRVPLPHATRQASGAAFIAARAAVTRAKKADARFALDADGSGATAAGASAGRPHPGLPAGAPILAGAEVEALIATVLLLRQRRSPEGWAAVDLLRGGLSQVDIAARLGITPAAVSQRIKSSLWRVEEAAHPALVRLVEDLEQTSTETDTAG
ncbi:winged helix-turn-helix transcriptional regulator [Cryobacterium sp. MDB1-18-2]|uniref:winged helix-turn-helix transcriptional regulator n=1 Tax=unclassified Cryobacterium TaxID=2649013 RepID=UPI001068FBF6|nr:MULTISPECIES: winged helix-turn-helix transcriptional regulator [unclassified Cryobacterium]MDY7527217.1 winged helix-turn-helix transcriptional regulator [Cryobacterium sp. 10C2]MEB0004117.1 winged helix-turn-helix transcriptional regulator [Cryobacterium sp. RTC2.1]MEB0200286.1 winged helix-turn-helix transcriptional regulator [Cryobacterium sp. 5I3]MEB0286563.1 winged helix-turn-helix transcriptional regulator [Cryobacterium sp. 10S3]MEB0292304.1 winged helix-turn-helix transcriptional r